MSITTNASWKYWFTTDNYKDYTYTNDTGNDIRLSSVTVYYGSGNGKMYRQGSYSPNTESFEYGGTTGRTKEQAIALLRDVSNYTRLYWEGVGARYNLHAAILGDDFNISSQTATISHTVAPVNGAFDASNVLYEDEEGVTGGAIDYLSGQATQVGGTYANPTLATTLTFDYSENDRIISAGASVTVRLYFQAATSVIPCIVIKDLTGAPSVVEETIIRGKARVNVSNVWKSGNVKVNVNGDWKAGDLYTRVNGVWKRGI